MAHPSLRTPHAPSTPIAGIPFQVTSFDGAVETVLRLVQERSGVPVRLANAYSVALASRSSSYLRLFQTAGLTFPDGSPVAWLLRRLGRTGGTAAEQVRGPAFFEAVLRAGVPAGVRHYFLGGSAETVDALLAALEGRFPGVQVAGASSPPFGPVDDAFVDAAQMKVRAARADMLWVALGTPKQDFAADLLARRLDMPVAAVGAAFDFTAGSVRPAPRFVQRMGMEWAHRLITEPRRLWRRYLFGNVRFLVVAARELRRRSR